MRNVLANWLWLLLFGALAFGFIIGGWSASKEVSPQQHALRGSAAQGSSEPRSTAISEAHTEQNSAKADDKKEPHGGTFLGWISNFFEVKLTDLLIAIFTVVLALETSGLFRETAGLRELAAEQSRDMKDSIKAVQRNADAAFQAIASDRAWITVDNIFPINGRTGKTKAYRSIRRWLFSSFGKTPAEVRRSWRNSPRIPKVWTSQSRRHLPLHPTSAAANRHQLDRAALPAQIQL
jgi:hypothetical protein